MYFAICTVKCTRSRCLSHSLAFSSRLCHTLPLHGLSTQIWRAWYIPLVAWLLGSVGSWHSPRPKKDEIMELVAKSHILCLCLFIVCAFVSQRLHTLSCRAPFFTQKSTRFVYGNDKFFSCNLSTLLTRDAILIRWMEHQICIQRRY